MFDPDNLNSLKNFLKYERKDSKRLEIKIENRLIKLPLSFIVFYFCFVFKVFIIKKKIIDAKQSYISSTGSWTLSKCKLTQKRLVFKGFSFTYIVFGKFWWFFLRKIIGLKWNLIGNSENNVLLLIRSSILLLII